MRIKIVPQRSISLRLIMCISLFTLVAQIVGKQPNIVFIMADDLGYGQLGAYGQQQIKTPRIDQMAKDGLLLTDYYAGTAVCAPSRCTLMTGLHVGHTFIRGNYEIKATETNEPGQLPIPDSSITVAEKLKEAGYATACIGKWGLGYPFSEGDPMNQGFDYFYGYNCQRHAHSYYPGWLWKNHDKVSLGARNTAEGYSHYRLTEEARAFIETKQDQPFFLYLAYTIPHSHIQIPATDPNYTQYLGEDWPSVQKRLAGMISLMDQDVGGLIDLLCDLGIAENTLVIFTSDNGASKSGGVIQDFFNDSGPLRGIKRDMYEGGTRVPFIAYWPTVIESGRRSKHIAAHWDLMATACEMAGVVTPKETDSISYLPLLKGDIDQQTVHKSVYFELHWPTRRAVREGDWVAVQSNTSAHDPQVNQTELYNLKEDLAQENDRAGENPEKLAHLRELLEAAHTPSEHFAFGRGRPNKNKK